MQQVRHARPEDAATLASLGERTFRETFAADNRPEDMDAFVRATYRPELQAAELSDPQVALFLLEENGRALGFLKLQRDSGPGCPVGPSPAELCRLYVLAEAHGSGAGARLMETALAQARTWGNKTLWLGVWEHNHRALAFYRKFDFVHRGEMPFTLGADVQRDLVLARPV